MTQLKRKFFNPRGADGQDGVIKNYSFWDDGLIDHVNMAMAISRPLLLDGEPGVGKSSVAMGIADAMGQWGFLKETIRSRMEAAELKADFDAIARLSDAQVKGGNIAKNNYITPGKLWQAYDPKGARDFMSEHGGRRSDTLDALCKKPGIVLLIDEIDKGDLDFANDLLDVFDEGAFTDPASGVTVERQNRNDPNAERNLLIVITSNKERELSAAFQRRCLHYKLNPPAADQKDKIVSIGRSHIMRRLGQGAAQNAKQSQGRLDNVQGWLTDDRLMVLAELSKTSTINVSRYADAIDATLAFFDDTVTQSPDAQEWDGFTTLLRQTLPMRAMD